MCRAHVSVCLRPVFHPCCCCCRRACQVQENCIDLVGRIADRGAEHVPAREWMRICFELLDMLKAHKKAIRRATVNTFGYIAKAIGPQDVSERWWQQQQQQHNLTGQGAAFPAPQACCRLACHIQSTMLRSFCVDVVVPRTVPQVLVTLLNNLKVQERQNRVCTTVAIAIVAETCAPFTVLPALMNEYRVPELNVQNGVLKALSFMFEYIGEMGKDYIYAVTPLLQVGASAGFGCEGVCVAQPTLDAPSVQSLL